MDSHPELPYLASIYALHSDLSLSLEFPRPSTCPILFEQNPTRLFPILNALASICVYKPKGQVVAVSVAIAKAKVTIFVAQNDGVPDKVVKHFYSVWHLLQQLAKSIEHPARTWDQCDCPQPQLTPQSDEIEEKLILSLYRFSWPKFLRRVRKRSEKFLRFRDFCVKELEKSSQAAGDADFRGLLDVLDIIVGLTASEMDDSDILLVASGLLNLKTLSGPLLERNGSIPVVDVWVGRYQIATKCFFPCRRYIEKLVSPHNHIHALRHLAYSHRLQPFLSSELEVFPVSPQNVSIAVNLGRDTVMSLLRTSLHATTSDDMLLAHHAKVDNDLKKKFPKLKGSDTISCNIQVHCECLLLAYHHHHPELAPFNYIGVSKLSCFLCHQYFAAYNACIGVDRIHFQTQGSHHKIYFPTVTPTLEVDGSLDVQMNANISEHLETALTEELGTCITGGRSKSDSTNTSGSHEGHAPDMKAFLRVGRQRLEKKTDD